MLFCRTSSVREQTRTKPNLIYLEFHSVTPLTIPMNSSDRRTSPRKTAEQPQMEKPTKKKTCRRGCIGNPVLGSLECLHSAAYKSMQKALQSRIGVDLDIAPDATWTPTLQPSDSSPLASSLHSTPVHNSFHSSRQQHPPMAALQFPSTVYHQEPGWVSIFRSRHLALLTQCV